MIARLVLIFVAGYFSKLIMSTLPGTFTGVFFGVLPSVGVFFAFWFCAKGLSKILLGEQSPATEKRFELFFSIILLAGCLATFLLLLIYSPLGKQL